MSEMGERIPIRVHSAVNVHRLLCRPIDPGEGDNTLRGEL